MAKLSLAGAIFAIQLGDCTSLDAAFKQLVDTLTASGDVNEILSLLEESFGGHEAHFDQTLSRDDYFVDSSLRQTFDV